MTNWWTPGSFVNSPIPADSDPSFPGISPNSTTAIAALVADSTFANAFMFPNGSALVSGEGSTTVYHATTSTTQQTVALAIPFGGPGQVGVTSITLPLDPSWVATGDSDHHLTVICDEAIPVPGFTWADGSCIEFQDLDTVALTAHSAAVENILTQDGSSQPNNWVSVLPELTGLIRPEEVEAIFLGSTDRIPHALRFECPSADAWTGFVFPAQHSDGSGASTLIPGGGFIQLDPTLALGPFSLDPWQTLIALTLQTWGMYLGDNGGSGACYLQSTADGITTYAITPSGSLPSTLVPHLRLLGGTAPPPTPPTPPITPSSGITLPTTGGAQIAFQSQAFDTDPTWSGPLKGVHSVQIDRGSNSLLSKAQTGTMTLTFYDETGRYDPTNPNGPFYQEIGPMRSVNYQLLNPVDKSWHSLFTGFTETWDFTYPATPAATIMQAALTCVDGFDALNRAELPPDNQNTTTIPPFVGLDAVKGRMFYILSFFAGPPYSGNGYPTDPAAIFSGNVNVFNAVYNPQTTLLTALQDTGDAEFPNVSNTFMDKFGNIAFRGRGPMFLPDAYYNASGPTVLQPVTFWNVGDANACSTWPTNPPNSPVNTALAPFNDLGWDRDQTTLVNACEAYPGNIGTQTAALTDQLQTNGLSILKNGPRTLSIPDLYTAGTPPGSPDQYVSATANPFLNPAGLSAKQECLLFANYFVQNLADTQDYVNELKFVTVEPGTTRGNQWWQMVCGVEIGDVVVLYVTDPGGGGMTGEQFFVRGIHYDIEIGGPYPQITMTLDVLPRSWFSTFNGFVFYPDIPANFFSQHGNPTNGSAVFNDSFDNPFTNASVGRTLIVLDPSAPAVPGENPYSFVIVGVSSASTVTLDRPYTGTTSMTAPFEIVG
jgi:hypothetical protein